MAINENDAVKILDYWFTMEFLYQQTLKEFRSKEKKTKIYKDKLKAGMIQPQNIVENVIQMKPTDSLRTVAQSSASAMRLWVWGDFTVFIGSVKKEECIRKISQNIEWHGQGPDANNDEIALAILKFSKDGKFIQNSLELSPLAWAMNKISTGTNNISRKLSVEEYENDTRNTEKWIANLFAPIEEFSDEQNNRLLGLKCISYEMLQQVKDKILTALNLHEPNICQLFLVDFKLYKSEEDIEEEENDISLHMDFYSKDLAKASEGIRKGYLTENKKQLLVDYILGLERFGLTPEKAPRRIDILKPSNDEELYEFMANLLTAKKAPLGKWPSRFMPVLMQQIAINLAINEENELPIFSVNGPPGTGKTTLLKEIIVNNIIQKANLLAEYNEPDLAFTHYQFEHGEAREHSYNQYVTRYHRLRDKRINAYSILVTSSNNTAVENITKELPLEEKIIGDLMPPDEQNTENNRALQELAKLFTVTESEEKLTLVRTIWHEDPNGVRPRYATKVVEEVPDIYFSEFATKLLNVGNQSQNTQQAFGLISAALGKKSNIQKVDDEVIGPLIELMKKNDTIEARKENYRSKREKFKKQFLLVQKMGEALDELIIQEKNFHIACKEAEKEKDQLKGMQTDQYRQLTKLNKTLAEQQENINAINAEKERVEKKAADIHAFCEKLESEIELQQRNISTAKTRIDVLQKSVSVFGRLFKTSKYKEVQNAIAEVSEMQEQYLQRMNELNQRLCGEQESLNTCQKAIEHMDVKINEKSKQIVDLQSKIKKVKTDIQWTWTKISAIDERIREQKRLLEQKEADYRNANPYDRGFALDRQYVRDVLSSDIDVSTKAQLRNPWFSDHYNREREKLFLYALQMTKEFILSSKNCRENLKHLHCLWSGSYGDNRAVKFKDEDLQNCTAAAYETLFMLIPVVSSTFSSVQKLFENVQEEDIIGTLIVDEAGQASPHMAIGALCRARKAIIVGDPKQVEPIVTDDQDLLRQTYTDEIFKPYADKTNSVQRFADIMNPYGTYLENDQGVSEWVGCPLLVHRRCISPMYDISNDISYNHIMKQQTANPKPEKESTFVESKSQWINISGNEAGKKKHFVKEQGDKVIEMLETAFSKNPAPDLFIISPFATVVSGITDYIKQYVSNCQATGTESSLLENRQSLVSWLNQKIGTVHRFQGKEAAEVIFLLGCDTSSEATPAIRWVNNNIVNVAATRAKYRLYVIGDSQAWKQSKCVNRAKEIMDQF